MEESIVEEEKAKFYDFDTTLDKIYKYHHRQIEYYNKLPDEIKNCKEMRTVACMNGYGRVYDIYFIGNVPNFVVSLYTY